MIIRPRRNRICPVTRELSQETSFQISDIIAPLFLINGKKQKEPIESMPGIYRFSLDLLADEIAILMSKGINKFALFPVIHHSKKCEKGLESINPAGLIPEALKFLSTQLNHPFLITDIALDPYTTHGHDGVCNKKGEVLNDETIEILANQAVLHALSGSSMVAPSDMMDGRIKKIREKLDREGFHHIPILSYAAKYASSLYAPFREALGVNLQFGDKKSYQLNPANSREAVREALLDEQEGADLLLVKPATLYLDIIAKIKDATLLPVGAYHVSGEYSMIALAAQLGHLDKHKVFYETLLSIKRAGASFIFTYAYREMLELFGH